MARSVALLVGDRLPVHRSAERLPAERGPGTIQRQHRRRRRASASTRWSRTRLQVADIVAQDPEHRQRRRCNVGQMGDDGDRRLEPGPHVRRAEAAGASATRSVDESSRSCARSSREIPGMRVFMSTSRRSTSAAAARTAQLYQFTLQDTDTAELYKWAPVLRGQDRGRLPGFEDVNSDLQLNNPQVTVEIDRDKLSALGLDRQPDRERALQRLRHAAGLEDLRAEQPIPGDPATRAAVPAAIPRRCRCSTSASNSGRLVPLDVGRANDDGASGRSSVNHFGQLPAVTISFNLAPGFALGDAVDADSGDGGDDAAGHDRPRSSRAPRRRFRTRCAGSACCCSWRSS